jgi:ribonuclease HI
MRAIAYCDGGGNTGTPCSCAVVLKIGETFYESATKLDVETNNQAEYHGVLLALNFAMKKGVKDLTLFSDSQLVVHQMNGVYDSRHPHLKPLLIRAKKIAKQFRSFEIVWVERKHNKRADALCREVTRSPYGSFERTRGPSPKPRNRPGGPLKKKPPPFPVQQIDRRLSSQELLDLGY